MIMKKQTDEEKEIIRLRDLLQEKDRLIERNRQRLLEALGMKDGYTKTETYADLLLVAQGLRAKMELTEYRHDAMVTLLRAENAKVWHLLRGKMEDPTLLEKGDEKNRPQPTPFDVIGIDGMPMPVMRFN